MNQRNVPVYLFTGFLESGKTKFIKETLQDPRFNEGERTLLLVCEDGENTYDEHAKYMFNTTVVYFDSQEDINSDVLEELAMKHDPEQVMIEYNGMWTLNTIFSSLPANWMIYQFINFADANTIADYSQMFRNLFVEKISGCEMVVFNRMKEDTDKVKLHQLVRIVSRRCQIAFEYPDGRTEYDDIEDPLPFDLDAPVIEIEKPDYAMWYRDCVEEPKKYDNKVVHVSGLMISDETLGKNYGFGMKVMTCCEADIQFMGFVAENKTKTPIKVPGWFEITAEIKIEYHKLYRREGPVLKIKEIKEVEHPKNDVATFY